MANDFNRNKHYSNKRIILKKFAKNLKSLRQKNNLTQEFLADKLKIHTVTYARYETRPYNIRLYNLYKISKFFAVSLDDLIR